MTGLPAGRPAVPDPHVQSGERLRAPGPGDKGKQITSETVCLEGEMIDHVGPPIVPDDGRRMRHDIDQPGPGEPDVPVIDVGAKIEDQVVPFVLDQIPKGGELGRGGKGPVGEERQNP
jgi:hypothetical protein